MSALSKHLQSRWFNPALYQHKVLDEDNQILTVYLHNLSGQLVGYQQYNPNQTSKRTNDPKDARYFTYVTPGYTGVWGLELLDPDMPYCFVVEGIFKASMLHVLGFNAIAILTSSPSKSLLNWLYAMPYTFIAIGDPDEAGERLIRKVGKGAVSVKDLDELEPSYVRKFCIALICKWSKP